MTTEQRDERKVKERHNLTQLMFLERGDIIIRNDDGVDKVILNSVVNDQNKGKKKNQMRLL